MRRNAALPEAFAGVNNPKIRNPILAAVRR
jgi:hypothetical protein